MPQFFCLHCRHAFLEKWQRKDRRPFPDNLKLLRGPEKPSAECSRSSMKAPSITAGRILASGGGGVRPSW